MTFTALKKLVPPSAFLTSILETREDLRKIREYLRELTDWAGAQFSSIAGSSFPPSGTAGGDLAGTYPNPNVAALHETSGPTKLTIAAVSNGQMLTRSGSTIVGAAIPTTLPPSGSAGGDLGGTYPNPTVVALESATTRIDVLGATAPTAGQILTATDSTHATWQASNGYRNLPASANAFDDNFFLGVGSADLVTRGWTFWNQTDNTNMTRNGDINPWGTAAVLAANQYNSRLVPGVGLILQMPISTNKNYYLYKAVTLPAGITPNDGGTVWFQIGQSLSTDTVAASFVHVHFMYNSAGRPDPANRVYIEMNNTGTASWRFHRGAITAGVDSGADINFNQSGQTHDILGIRTLGSNTHRCFAVNSLTNGIWNTVPTTTLSKASFAYAGLGWWTFSSAGANANNANLYTLGFARLNTGSQNNFWITG
jgi:hypothetical protein